MLYQEFVEVKVRMQR